MTRLALIDRFVSLGLVGAGVLLIAAAIGLAVTQRSAGKVFIRAEGLARLVLVKDVSEVRQIEIVNGTSRPITLHNAQGWG
ncbi:MAG: hypothetical protein ACR2FY_21425 [Pirellulaceae bacterium]